MYYIGSKKKLNNFIYEEIMKFSNLNLNNRIIFADIFAGTGVVSEYWKLKNHQIIANDIQYYSFVRLNSKLNTKEISKNKINTHINDLNRIKLKAGFITKNYSKFKNQQRQFYSVENAKIIDSIRIKIEHLFLLKKINEKEYYFLLNVLIEESSKKSNTASVFEAYLKSFKPIALKKIVLPEIKDLTSFSNSKIYNEKAEDLIKNISGDILYLDPPYNSRNYDTNYHMLETIALYDNPKIKNLSGRREEETKNSVFTKKALAESNLLKIIEEAQFKYIAISYNSEGLINLNEFKNKLHKNFQTKIVFKKYKRFKSNNSAHQPKTVEEQLLLIRKSHVK